MGAYTKSDGTKIYTCAIITTNANPLMAEVHDRMPVILTEEARNCGSIRFNKRRRIACHIETVFRQFNGILSGFQNYQQPN